MTPIARALSPEERRAVSDYYAALQAPASSSAPASKGNAANARARTLAFVGDNNRRVQACANCHGPNGIGEAPTFPYLAGQHATYLTTALKDWREGRRKSDPSGQMPTIAHALSDSDIDALATYFAAQSPPAPAPSNQATATRAVPTGRTAAGSSGSSTAAGGTGAGSGASQQSSGDTSAARGTGVEQGAPTTGGGQGIGGGGAASGSGPQGSPEGNPSANGGSSTGSPNAQRSVPGDAQTPGSGGGTEGGSKAPAS